MASVEQGQADWQVFVDLMELAVKKGLSEELFQLLFTFDERDALATRVRIIQELMKGELTQREIKEQLKVGIATVTRGSNCLKSATPQLRQWLEDQLLS